MNKLKDTKIGKFLAEKAPHVLDVAGSLLPDAGLLGVVKNLIDKDPNLSPEDKQQIHQQLVELYKLEVEDRNSARQREVEMVKAGSEDWMMNFTGVYKVIFVTLELRHAPWIGWIKDLSAPDPSTILNLFGLLPWANPFPPESLLFIFSLGILPILLGISMWLQQKLNPAPTDATQAMIFAWMPWVFMFMLGTFASGLIIYWIANNMITFAQQYMIMRSQGYKPDVFGNIKASFKRKKT